MGTLEDFNAAKSAVSTIQALPNVSTAEKRSWTSDHPVLKNHTFMKGTAEFVAQFVESLKKYLESVHGMKSQTYWPKQLSMRRHHPSLLH